MIEWIIATRSHGKLLELVPLLAAHGITGIGLERAGIAATPEEELIEVFSTFRENAIAKAAHFAAITGKSCLADDSGLCIDALDGGPGVRSRRFALDRGVMPSTQRDEDACNNEVMLDACWDSGRAPPWAAHYACAAALVDGARVLVACGRTDGAILPDGTGDGGFGYDPFFVSGELGVSFGVASRALKAGVSHRARAVANLVALRGS